MGTAVVDENEVVDADGVRRCGRALLLLVGVLLPACASSGQGAADWRAAQPERPTVATHAYAVAPGVVEVEAGVQALHPAGGAETDAPVVMKFGAAPRLQVELQGGWTRKRAGVPAGAPPGPAPGALSGLTDLAIAPKLQLLDGAPILANFSIQPSLKLPTGSADKGTGTGTTDVGLLLISSRSGGPFSLDLNAGVTRRDGDGSNAPRTATFLTASGGVSLSSGLGWVLECFSFPGTSGPAGARTQVGLLSGPTWAVRPWLVLDAGAIGNLAGLPATSIYAGLTWNIGRLRDWPSGRRAVRSRP
jgi:hypothetical protein